MTISLDRTATPTPTGLLGKRVRVIDAEGLDLGSEEATTGVLVAYRPGAPAYVGGRPHPFEVERSSTGVTIFGVHVEPVEPVVSEEAETIAALRAEVARLSEDNAAANRERVAHLEESTRHRERVEAYRSDVRTIGETLKGHARDEGWCETYDRHVREAAASLRVAGDTFEEAALLRREFYVEVPVVMYVSVPVTAEDEDEARDYAASEWHNYITGDEHRDTHGDSSSWDVSEQD